MKKTQTTDIKTPDPRTLRRWKREGAPTDDPKKLAIWCLGRGKRVSPPRPGGVPPGPADVDSSGLNADKLIEAHGLLGATARLKKLEVFHYQRMKEAEINGDSLEATLRARLHNEAIEALRTTEMAAFQLEVLQKKYLLASDVESEVSRMNFATKSFLRFKFETEFPPCCEGKTVAEIQKLAKGMIVEVCELLSK